MEKEEVSASDVESPAQEVEGYESLKFICSDKEEVSYPADLVKLFSFINPMLNDLNDLKALNSSNTLNAPVSLVITKHAFSDAIGLLKCIVLGTLKDSNLSIPTQLYYQQRQKIDIFFMKIKNINDIHNLALGVNYLNPSMIGVQNMLLDIVLTEYAERFKNMSIKEYEAQLEAINNDLSLPSELVNLMRDHAFIKPILQCLQGISSIVATSTSKPELCSFMQLKINTIIANAFNKKGAILAAVLAGAPVRGPNDTVVLSRAVPITIDIAKKERYTWVDEAQSNTIKRMVFSNDGALLASIGINDPQLIVHKLDKSFPYLIEREDKVVPLCCAFSNDSKRLAVGYADGSLEIHDLRKMSESRIALVNVPGENLGITSVAFHPFDNTMLVCSNEKMIRALLFSANIHEVDNIIIPKSYAQKALAMNAQLERGMVFHHMRAMSTVFTLDGKWIIGTYVALCSKKDVKGDFHVVFSVRWPIANLDAPGEIVVFECLDIDPVKYPISSVDVQTDILHQKCAVQVFFANTPAKSSRFCVVDFKNKKSGVVQRCNGVAVGYGALITYFQSNMLYYREDNAAVHNVLVLKMQPLCCAKFFPLVTTTGEDPFVFLNKDATGLVIPVDNGRLATYTLYSDTWRTFFEYLKTCPISLKELHELYVMCMSMSEQGDVSANDVCVQLSTIPALQQEIATRFGTLLPVAKKAEETPVSVPKPESGALTKLLAVKNAISKSAGYYAKQLKNEVTPPQSQPLFVAQPAGNQPGAVNQSTAQQPLPLVAEEEEEEVKPGLLLKVIAFPLRMLRLVWRATLGQLVNYFFS
jgi:hypothetical protein